MIASYKAVIGEIQLRTVLAGNFHFGNLVRPFDLNDHGAVTGKIGNAKLPQLIRFFAFWKDQRQNTVFIRIVDNDISVKDLSA